MLFRFAPERNFALSAIDSTETPLLVLDDVEVLYDRVIMGLRGVSLTVPERSVVALLGANGAGKSTTLKAASGLLAAERGEVCRGQVRFRGEPVTKSSPLRLARAGLVQVLEGRHCFPHLTVEENLATGAYASRPSRRELKFALERTYDRFPRLRDRRRVAAGHLSGGEQQMVAIGRALMGRPVLVLLDEPSMGLAPRIVEEIFALVRDLHVFDNVSFVLAEQNAAGALAVADSAYVLENGRVIASGTADGIRARDDVQDLYLGRPSGRRPAFEREKNAAPQAAANSPLLRTSRGHMTRPLRAIAVAIAVGTFSVNGVASATVPEDNTTTKDSESAPATSVATMPSSSPASALAPDSVTTGTQSKSEAPAAPATAGGVGAAPLAVPEWLRGVTLGAGLLVWYYQPIVPRADGVENNVSVFGLIFSWTAIGGPSGCTSNPDSATRRCERFRLRWGVRRSSPILRTTARGSRKPMCADIDGLQAHLKLGKEYSHLGYFWDNSFYGNVQVYDGLKLDPDYGASLEGDVGKGGDPFALGWWAQYFVVDGGTNVSLPGRDTIPVPGSRRRNQTILRVEPRIRVGPASVAVGVSGEYVQADIASIGPQDVWRGAVDAAVNVGGLTGPGRAPAPGRSFGHRLPVSFDGIGTGFIEHIDYAQVGAEYSPSVAFTARYQVSQPRKLPECPAA